MIKYVFIQNDPFYLPKVLDKYSDSLPFLTDAGSGTGVEPGMAARYAFGAAIVAVLVFAPGGIGSLWRSRRVIPSAISIQKEETQ